MWVYFGALYSAPLIHMSIFVPMLHCFDSCSFVVLSEVWESDASCFVFIPQDCFGKSGTFRVAIVEKSTNNKCKRRCGEKGTLLHCWWECKLVMQLWNTVQRFLRRLKIELPHDPAIPLLGIHRDKTIIQKDVCRASLVAQ